MCRVLFPGVDLGFFCGTTNNTGESMAGRGRNKKDQPTASDIQEGSGESGIDERSMLELFISNQARRDEEMSEKALLAEKKQLEAEERAEVRRLKAAIAAEEREEKRRERAEIAAEERREKAKVAEEERLEARVIEKERRKREEALRLEEANKEKEEAARRAAEKIVELQEEAAKRDHEQRRELMEMQAEIGRKVSEAHRLETEKSRNRDRVIFSLPVYRKDEDIEDFLLALERKLELGGIPEEEWLSLVAAKLTGELGVSWQELCMGEADYRAVRAALLKGCGYTPRAAGEAYYGFRQEHLKGLAGEQVYKRGAQLLKRMIAPTVLDKETVFKIVKPWVYACVGRGARSVLETREVDDAEALARGLQDYLANEGERVTGKSAVFGGEDPNVESQTNGVRSEGDRLAGRVAVSGTEGTGPRRPAYGVGPGSTGGNGGSSMKCFVCGRMGHKAVDCWHREKGVPEAKAAESKVRIICYICGVEGHKATTCPGKKEAPKGDNVKQIRQIRLIGTRAAKNSDKATDSVLKIARVTLVEPKAMEQMEGIEKKIVKKGNKERDGSSWTASGKTAKALTPNSRTVTVSGRQNKGTAVMQKNRLKPEKAFDVVLRASVVEQARMKNRAKARLEFVSRKRKMNWEKGSSQSGTSKRLSRNVERKRNIKLDGLGVRAEEERMKNFGFVLDGLGVRAEDDTVKEKDDFVGVSNEVNENKRKKNCVYVSAGFSPLSSKPTASVVCCAADGLGTFTGKGVSYRDVLLSSIPSQTKDSRYGDPKRKEGGDLRKRIGDSRQSDAGSGERKRTSIGAEATENDLSSIPSQTKDSRFGDPKRKEGGDLRERIADSQRLDDGRSERKRITIEEDEPGLRAAPFLFVWGDVGTESPQKEGVATYDVAQQN